MHGYAPFRGLPRLREAIAARYRDLYGADIDPEREVAIVPGTKTAIIELCLGLGQRGDTILLPDPGYPDYQSGVAFAGAELGTLPLDPSAGWAPDFDAAPPAAAVFLNYPSNPCAACAPPGTYEAAVAYAERTGAAIVADAAYIDLVYDGREPESFLATPGGKDVGVEMWTTSKTFGMAGWRIGFVVGNAEIVERVNLQGDHSRVGMFAPLQEATIAALTGPQDSVEERRATYERRRDRLIAALPEPPVCQGSFYVWLRLPEGLTADRHPRRAARRDRAGRGLRPERRRLGAALARGRRRRAGRGDRAARARARGGVRMKIGIVVPFSWSYWGGVVEHAENQADALRARGHEVKIVMGNDPPGRLTRLLHPRTGRHGQLPPDVIPVGRSVVVPGQRLAAEHRAHAARRSTASATCCATSASTWSTCTSR